LSEARQLSTPAGATKGAISQLPPGEWPSDPNALPIFLTEPQLAHLLGKTVSTLRRRRRLGQSIPFRIVGRDVLCDREDVLASVRGKSFPRTQEANVARQDDA